MLDKDKSLLVEVREMIKGKKRVTVYNKAIKIIKAEIEKHNTYIENMESRVHEFSLDFDFNAIYDKSVSLKGLLSEVKEASYNRGSVKVYCGTKKLIALNID